MSPEPQRPGAEGHGNRRGWRRLLRSPPVRWMALLVVVLLLLEYVVIPALVGASRNLNLLSRLDVGWLVAGTALEAASLLSYALLTRGLLLGRRPGLFTLVRITVATAAVSHLVPVGAAGSAGLGYQLLTARGVTGTEAAFALATGAVGSAVVLNMCLLLALLISIPFAGLHPIFVVMALVGVLALLGSYALVYLLTRGEARAVRAVRAVGRRVPRIGADRLERVVRDFAGSVAALIADRRLLRSTTTWAALNWLLDAASLWAFLAALGRLVNPVELFAAYGIGYVLAVIPVTPAGLGVIEVTVGALLVSFGIPRTVATLGVIGWRVVNFWLPIPVGVAAFLSLEISREAGRPGLRGALARMITTGHHGSRE